MKYKSIQNKNDYLKLLKTGMFFEFYPELTGNWNVDVKTIRMICSECGERGFDSFGGCCSEKCLDEYNFFHPSPF